MNNFVNQNNIQLVSEFGCGAGYRLFFVAVLGGDPLAKPSTGGGLTSSSTARVHGPTD